MSDSPVRYRMSGDVVTRDFDDGILIVNLESGKTWKLNQVGAAVCRGIEARRDLAQVVAELQRSYGVAVESLRKDVEALVGNLEREGIVLIDPGA
jgi:hypothetical protein